jgi:hypothetical protein
MLLHDGFSDNSNVISGHHFYDRSASYHLRRLLFSTAGLAVISELSA